MSITTESMTKTSSGADVNVMGHYKSMARASWSKLGVMLAVFALMLPLSMMSSWRLTALRLGEDRAISFGIDVRRLRLGTLLRISMLSALAVAFIGPIGFIGLVAPHIARMMFGEQGDAQTQYYYRGCGA